MLEAGSFKDRAREARKRFYARPSTAEVESVEPPGPLARAIRSPLAPGSILDSASGGKKGLPCKTHNPGWGAWVREIAGKGISVMRVMTSGDVPETIRMERMASCLTCPHCTTANDLHWCECCGCPKWNWGGISASLEYKNRKQAWRCPRPSPAFNEYGVGIITHSDRDTGGGATKTQGV